MISEILEAVLVFLTSLVHSDHGLDLERGKKNVYAAEKTSWVKVILTLWLHFDSFFAVVFQILLAIFELLLLFVAFPMSLRK